jgi:hypothetical protein
MRGANAFAYFSNHMAKGRAEAAATKVRRVTAMKGLLAFEFRGEMPKGV